MMPSVCGWPTLCPLHCKNTLGCYFSGGNAVHLSSLPRLYVLEPLSDYLLFQVRWNFWSCWLCCWTSWTHVPVSSSNGTKPFLYLFSLCLNCIVKLGHFKVKVLIVSQVLFWDIVCLELPHTRKAKERPCPSHSETILVVHSAFV